MPHIDIHSGPSYGTLDDMEQRNDEEGDQLLQGGYLSEGNHSSDTSLSDEVQEGVRKIEAINLTWTTRTLIIAYIRFVHGFCGQVVVKEDSVLTCKPKVFFSWRFVRL